MLKRFDVIVVGGGHAGCEACLAAARTGCQTALITFSLKGIGLMSCNPAVGGVGKGQLVKELDALGGQMASIADRSGIQFRRLNSSKGPAVWSSRVQVDRSLFARLMLETVQQQSNLTILEGEVSQILVEKDTVKGVQLASKQVITAEKIILAPGTFLNGTIHMGLKSFPGGRLEERQASKKLASQLRFLGFKILRFKTGTCARLDGKSIDFSRLVPQYGDEPPRFLSFSSKNLKVRQLPCYLTYTNEQTHNIIRENLHLCPLYTGKITGTGVRYCPSLEDKVVKFSHHPRHQIFLEPEDAEGRIYYPNGLSTSLPPEIQEAFIRTIAGLGNVRLLRYGYGIEHDVVEPTQLLPTLETKKIKNLYLAGQINGTTGYEEAAVQGLLAGLNASLTLRKKEPLVPGRHESYIGVLIDDLTSRGTNEPYRMFTSRVEYRLVLREDNADIRLTEKGYQAGLVSTDRWKQVQQKKALLEKLITLLKNTKVKISGKTMLLSECLRKPDFDWTNLSEYLREKFPDEVMEEAVIEVKYEPYLQRQKTEMKNWAALDSIRIPDSLDYHSLPGLSLEVKEKLSRYRPQTLGKASRLSGITPAAISLLLYTLKKRK